jgi:FkbM family methyltransferase
MRKKLTILYLEFLKRSGLLSKGRFITIKDGPLSGKSWLFNRSSSNEYILGIYEKEITEIAMRYMNSLNHLVLYDIGAHHGYFSLLATTKRNSQVYAFEPLPSNLDTLNKNLSSNGIGRAAIKLAISDQEGEVAFTNTDNSYANTYNSDSSMMSGSVDNTIKVRTNSLDNLIFKEKMDVPTYIKVDIEGAELDFLKGAEGVLSTHGPILQISTHDCHVPGITEKCLEKLAELGYQVMDKIDDELDSKGIADFFCVKKN